MVVQRGQLVKGRLDIWVLYAIDHAKAVSPEWKETGIH
jgi:hypothetical protein